MAEESEGKEGRESEGARLRERERGREAEGSRERERERKGGRAQERD